MIKSVLKVLYVAFALIIAFLVYMIGYNSNGYNYIQRITSEAIAENDYAEVAMIHGGCFDKINMITDEKITSGGDNLDMAIFPSANLIATTYYQENADGALETVTDNSYDNSYYIFIFNPQFETMNVTTSGTVSNRTGVRFKSETGSYDYYLTISESINQDLYDVNPLTVEDALLHGARDLTSNYINWNFYNITITDSIIDAIASELNGNVQSLAVLNSIGEEVYAVDVNLDFSQEFFTDVKPLVDHYTTYIEEYNAAANLSGSEQDAARTAAEEKFQAFYATNETTGEKGFQDTFLNERYTFRHDDSYLRPGSLVWQTIGMLAIYLVCVTLLYGLFFHFAFLKGLISRDKNYRRNPGARRAAPAGPQTTKNGKVEKSEAIDAKVETLEEEKNKE